MRPITWDVRAFLVRGRGLIVAVQALLCAAGLLLLAVSAQAFADTARFHIPAQPLSSALREFAVQAHMQLLYKFRAVENVRANPVNGELETRAALEQLLRGSGLEASYTSESSATIRPIRARAASKSAATDGGSGGAQSERGNDGSQESLLSRTDAASAGTVTLEEVVVTASKRKEPLKDVPAGITALTGSSLEKLGAQSFAEYQQYVPGLESNPTAGGFGGGGPGRGTIVIRGISAGNAAGNTATAGFYVGETPFTPSSTSSVDILSMPDPDLSDIARIEVLKGPQSTLYGASTLGGLIHIVPNNADLSNFGGAARVDGTTVEGGGTGYGIHGSVNIPLVTDQLGLRLNAFDRRDPGYVDNVRTGQTDINSARVDGGHLNLRYAANDRLDIELNGFYQEIRSSGAAQVDLSPTTFQPLEGRYQYAAYFNSTLDTRDAIANITLNYRLDVGTLVNSTSYAHYRSNQRYDVTNFYGVLYSLFGFFDPTAAVTLDPVPSMNKTTEEFRFTSNRLGRWELLGGLFYTHENIGYVACICGWVGPSPTTPLPAPFNNLGILDTSAQYDEYAVFGDATFYFTDQVDATVGARESHNNQNALTNENGLLTGTQIQPTKFSGSDTSYLFTARWRPTPNFSTYVRAASAYRPGGPQFGKTAGFPATFGPDTVWDYELGGKGIWYEGRVSADTAVYYIDWRNMQVRGVYQGLGIAENGGDAHSEGVEFQGRFEPVRPLSVGINAAYDRTRVESVSATSTTGAVVGDPLPFTPKWSAAATADYAWSLGGATFTPGVSYRYQGSSQSSFSGPSSYTDFTVPAYSVLDLRASLVWSHYNIAFFVDNVANKYAFSTIQALHLIPQVPPTTATGVPIQPRTYRLSIGTTF